MKAIAISASLLLAAPAFAMTGSPAQCVSWPRNMAEVKLKNVGIVDPAKFDESKTQAVRIASQKVGRDLYRDA